MMRAARTAAANVFAIGSVLLMAGAAVAVQTAAMVPSLSRTPTAATGAESSQQPVFRSGARLIVEAVTVKDKNGRPIEGLTARDFSVTEDGEAQTLSFVEYQELQTSRDAASTPGAPTAISGPLPADAAARAAPVVPQISVPPPGDTRYRGRRLLLLYFDLTMLPSADLLRACAAARTYMERQMNASDLVGVIAFKGGAVRVKQDFTANRAQLVEVIQDLIFGEDKDGDGIPDTEPGTAFGQDDGEFGIFSTDRQLAALQTAVSMLRPIAEQKSLLYFASGLRLTGTDNQAQLRATVNAAVRANVVIHTLDARGLVAQAPLGDATVASPGGLSMFNGQQVNTVTNNFQRSQDSLYALAKDTGGQAFFDNNDLSQGIVQAADAASSYYLIAYYSTHAAEDGRFRRVRVALSSGLSADLSYRQGYFADKRFAKFTAADKERQLEDALMLENPVTDITMAMEVNYFQLNRAQYFIPVAVRIPGSELALARRGGAKRTVIDFIGEVKDDYGYTQQNLRDKLDIVLSDDTASQLANRPIQIEIGFTLLPGTYVIKLLARDAETGRMGTYQASFTVPNLEREVRQLPMSSVVLSSQRVPLNEALFNVKQRLASEVVNPLVADGQKLMPSVTRVFSRSRDLFVFLEAYERGASSTQPLVAFVTLFREDVQIFQTSPVVVSDGMDPRSKAVPVRFSVPIDRVAPGRYDCQVTVLEPTGQKAAFWRAPIVVAP